MRDPIVLADLLPVHGGNDNKDQGTHIERDADQGIQPSGYGDTWPKGDEGGLAGTSGVGPADGSTAAGAARNSAISHDLSRGCFCVAVAAFEQTKCKVVSRNNRLLAELGVFIGEVAHINESNQHPWLHKQSGGPNY